MHIDHGWFVAGQRFVERRRELIRVFDTDAVAAHGAGDRRMVEIGKVTGDVPLALAVLDPTQCAVVEHYSDDGNVLFDRRHQPIHTDAEAAIATNGDHLTLRINQLGGERGWNGVAHPAHAGGLNERVWGLGLKEVRHEDAILSRITRYDRIVGDG